MIRTSFSGSIDWSSDPDSYREGKRLIWFLVCPCMNFMKLKYKNQSFTKNNQPHSYQQKRKVIRRLVPIYRESDGPVVEGVNVGGAVRRYESRYFSRKIVPAGKPPWRNFCKSRRKIKLSRLQDLSRAEVTNLADE